MPFLRLKWWLTFILLVAFSAFAQVGGKQALVIIDMQPFFVERGGNDKTLENKKKLDSVLEHQVKLIELAKAQNMPIIIVEYKGYGDTSPTLKQAVKNYEGVKYVQKNTDGMLDSGNIHREELNNFLKARGIKTLIITGANGGACVHDSIYGSLKENYSVIAYSKGIADFNYKEFIYPYDDKYNFRPKCESCTFREIDDYEAMLIEFTKPVEDDISLHIDNSSRGNSKDSLDVVPADKHVKPTSIQVNQQ